MNLASLIPEHCVSVLEIHLSWFDETKVINHIKWLWELRILEIIQCWTLTRYFVIVAYWLYVTRSLQDKCEFGPRCISWNNFPYPTPCWSQHDSGGSRGAPTARAPPPLRVQILSFRHTNFWKRSRLGSWRPPYEVWRPHMGNPGSATAWFVIHFEWRYFPSIFTLQYLNFHVIHIKLWSQSKPSNTTWAIHPQHVGNGNWTELWWHVLPLHNYHMLPYIFIHKCNKSEANPQNKFDLSLFQRNLIKNAIQKHATKCELNVA